MKKIGLFIAGILLISFFSNAQSLTFTLNFEKPVIYVTSDGFSEISIKNCYPMGDEGNPLLPLYAADILLPQGQEISFVEIVSVTYYKEHNGIKVRPAGKQFPISIGAPEGYKAVPNTTIYTSGNAYPKNIIENINTGYLAGHSIGSFSVCPVVYYPTGNKVKFIKTITVLIQTTASKREGISEMLKKSQVITERITRIVENSGELKNYSYPQKKDSDDVDILLITKNSMVANFDDYVNFKSSTGYITEIISTETIFSQYTGQDNQDKIRNCIKDFYLNRNLGYVILAGDADPNNSNDRIVPHRGFFAVDDDDIASDMYYCCLDGTWNDDGDNKWGEPGEYDLYAEVAIGRICIDNATEITNFTNKLKLYQNAPVVVDITKSLMVGEELNNNPPTYGDTYKEEIVNGTSLSGFTTVGMPDYYQISKLYDTQGGWDMYDVFQKFNTIGVNLLNHLGHSNVTYNMRMETTNLTTTNFTNNGINRSFVIGYSQGCYNGSFDNRDDGGNYSTTDCFAEKFTTIATGEVASVANSRYGWYSPGATNSSSQFHDRQFFDAIFGEGVSQIGLVNADAKEDNASFFSNDAYMRWTVYETNLFGDPSLDIWTEIPENIIANYPPSIPIGSITVAIQTNTPFARIGLTQNDVLLGRALTDQNGNANLQFFAPVTNTDPILVSIIAHNKNRHLGNMIVVSNQPFVLFQSYQINDPSGNGNGQVDFGETINLGLEVKNVGDQPASNVTVNLSSSCQYISVTDGMEYFGNFAAGQSVLVDNAFSFNVTQNIPDNCLITFFVEAVGDSTWNSSFTINAHAPELTSGGFVISDPSGNNNGRLDPGETVEMVFQVENAGQSDAPNTIAELMTSSPYLTINSPMVNLETLLIGENDEASFTLSADPSAPVGVLAPLSLQLSSGFYQSEENYSTKIGMIVEDWESAGFNQFNWNTSGQAVWTVTNSNPYEGSYCVKSGDIGDNQFSILMLAYNIAVADSISFYVKVSSEEGYDFLNFYIDSQIVGQWSGNKPWQRISFPVSAGSHNFKWNYDKDANTSSGSDCAWIDFIELPSSLMTTASAGMDDDICAGSYFDCSGSATNINSVLWSTSGSGYFSNATILNPVYTPSQADIDAGSVTLTLTATGSSGTLTDNMVLTINPLPLVDLGPDVAVYSYETVILDAGNSGALYLWSSGEITQTIEASSGGVAGDKTYNVEVTDLNGCSGSDEIVITFTQITGIDENLDKDFIHILPNPNNSNFILSLSQMTQGFIDINIFNSLSKLVFNSHEKVSNSTFEKQINLGNLTKGIYFLQVSGDGFKSVKKIIIQ
jgi:uncharacterized repeat protein (TIGR01451 family)